MVKLTLSPAWDRAEVTRRAWKQRAKDIFVWLFRSSVQVTPM
jgi:hypothetical protein